MVRPLCFATVFLFGVCSGLRAATTFDLWDLYYASNSNGAIYDISGGGDKLSLSPFTVVGTGVANLGDLTWSADLTTMYSSYYSGGKIYSTNANGVSTLYATANGPTAIQMTVTNRLLVAEYPNNRVMDYTNPASPTVFATGVLEPRNMVQLPNGKILVAGRSATNAPVIYDITAGGTPTIYATLPGTTGYAGDIEFTSTGKVYATTAFGNAVYEVTNGVVTPFATVAANLYAFGLAIDRRTDQILLAPLGQNYVWDITAGGNFTAASPKWATNIPVTNDMALEFVTPAPEPTAAALLALGGLGLISRRRRL